jgi:hypothetical protein
MYTTWAAAIYLNRFLAPVDVNVTAKYTLQSPKSKNVINGNLVDHNMKGIEYASWFETHHLISFQQ